VFLRASGRLPENARIKETIQAYRTVFGTAPGIQGEMGRVVFGWLLERCGLFMRIETDEQRTLHNWGIELLENMGLTQGMNYKALVESILQLGIPDEALDDAGRQKE
jgi:hypothetical protein